MNILELRSQWYRSEYAKNNLPMRVTGPDPCVKISTDILTRYKNMLIDGEITEVAFSNYYWPCGEHWWPKRFVVLEHSPPRDWVITADGFLDRKELAEILNTKEVRVRMVVNATIEFSYKVN